MNKILVFALSAIASTSLLAASPKTDRIRIHYVPPENPAHQEVYELLKQRQSLERLKEFLSPFRLKWVLDLTLTGCDGEPEATYGDDEITICYEYIDELREFMAQETTPSGIEPIDTLVGPFVDTVLHEFAHALFDYLDVPVLGREEDAADQVSAYIYLQVGEERARRLIRGTVYSYMSEVFDTDPPELEEFADEHSTSEQRAFNLLCMAYGSNPDLFKDIAVNAGLPQFRIDICEEEYELFSRAYQKLIHPHIDEALAKEVYKKFWLPEEFLDVPAPEK